ncbi:MAG: hypothetical protein GY774_19165 [Planctomycetes bacterium]|nr:hypothetical protein [Planctomycetota bacterium]
MKGCIFPSHHIRLTKEARKDLLAWRYFLGHFNSTPIIKPIQWSRDYDWKFFSDASGSGYASVFDSSWFYGSFPPSWSSKSIAVKELVPIYLSFLLWAPRLKNSKIIFMVDNMSVVCVLQSKTARDPVLMGMVRKMVVISMLTNIQFSAYHLPGKFNVVTDALSRFQVSKAKKLAPWLEEEPAKISCSFFPWSTKRLH